mmetsp:Transcript_5757/g.19943  ORF Transcript_5757/g.19943 Transcript_5757/m.19943 type:complete len:221 (+) Transcript_5757:820-1482(+)
MIRVQVKARQVDCRAVVVLGQEVDACAHLGEVPAVVERAVAVEVHVLHRGGAEEALGAAGDELVRGLALDEVAHLRDPLPQDLPSVVSRVPGLVGQLPSHNGWVLRVRQVHVLVGPSLEEAKVLLVHLPRGLRGVKLGHRKARRLVGVVRPHHVRLHAAVSVPKVGQREDELQAPLSRRRDHKVKGVEPLLVVLPGRGLQLAIVKGPRPHRVQSHFFGLV